MHLYIIWIVASLVIVWYAVLTLPRWLFTSLNRGCMWQLRDQVFSEYRRGLFPRNNDAEDFLKEIERAIVSAQWLTPVNLQRAASMFHRLPEPERHALLHPSGSQPTATDPLYLYKKRLHNLVTRQVMTGSWNGMIWFLALALRGKVRLTLSRDADGDLDHENQKSGAHRRPGSPASAHDLLEPVRGMAVEVDPDSRVGEPLRHAEGYLALAGNDDEDRVLEQV